MALAISPSLGVAQTAPPPATTTWTDSQGSWFSDGNWDNGQPGSGTDATVDNGGNPQVSGGAATAGVLTIGLGSGVTVGASSSLTISSGQGEGTITLDGGTLQSTAGANGPSISNGIAVTGNGGVIDSAGTNLSLTGTISGSGSTLTIENSAANTNFLFLNGQNSFSGTLIISHVPAAAGQVNAFGTGTLQVNADGYADMASYDQTVTALTGAGELINTNQHGAPGSTVNNVFTVQSGDFSGNIYNSAAQSSDADGNTIYSHGTISLVKVGSGTLTLTGQYSNYSGDTQIEDGTIAAGSSSALGAGAVTLSGGGRLQADVGSGGLSLPNAIVVGSGGGTIDSNGAGFLELTGGISSAATTGPLVFTGTNGNPNQNFDIVLSGANSFTGGAVIRNGTQVVSVTDNGIGSGSLQIDSVGVFAMGASDQAVTTLTGGGNIYANGFRGSGTTTSTLSVQSGSFSGILGDGYSYQVVNGSQVNYAGVLALAKVSDGSGSGGTLTLSGSNSYSGLTSVEAGTLRAGSTTAFSPYSLFSVASGATLALNGFSNVIGGLSGSGGTVLLQGGTLTVGASNLDTAFAGTIGDGTVPGGKLVKTGAGTLALNGTDTLAGGITVEQGTLSIGDDAALGDGPLALDRGTTLAFTGNASVANDLSLAQTGDPAIDTGPNFVTMSGTISGPGDLEKLGTGTLDLTGTNTYTGTTTVEQGTLLVDGSIASTTTVNSGAALGGAGTIAGFHVLGGGALAPGAGRSFVTLTATGNATFDAGSFYRIAINAAGQNDKVAIDGTATLNGGTVEVAATNGNYSSANRYTILTATGGRTGQFSNATLSSNLAFLTPTLSYGANDVVLGFAQTAGFQSAATTPNQRSVANAVQGLGPGNPVYQALLGQTPAGAQQALQSLSGQAHASTTGVAMSGAHFASRAVFDRFWNIPVDGGGDAVSVLDQFGSTTTPAALRCYTPQESASDGGLTPANYTVWGQAVGDFGRILGDGNAAAVTSTLGGFAFGLDSKLDAQLFDNWRVGVSAGYTADEFSVAGGGGRGTFQNVFGTLYGGARYGAVDVRLGGSFGSTGTTTDRTVAFPGFVEAEHANYGGSVAQGFGELGYRFALPQTVLEPVVGAGVTAVHEDHYRERGGAAALIGLAEDTTIETTTLGLRSEVTPFAEMPLVARVFLGWQHSYGDLDPATTQAFKSGSAAFSTYGTPLDRDAAVAETAIEYRASNEIKLSLAYSGQIGQRDRDNAVRGRADYRF